MQVNNNVVIFDFCQTICSFETADAFVEYVCQSESNIRIRVFNIIEKLLVKTRIVLLFDLYGHIMHHSVWKKFLLNKLKGIERNKLEQYAENYYRERIKTNFIPVTLQRLQEAQNKGYIVAVVSASYDIFLKLFAKEYNVGILVTNSFGYKDNKFTGKIRGKDCIYKNKVRRFQNAIGNRQIKVMESFGDSKSDIPILSIAKDGYVISHRFHKKWVDNTNYKEIIWQ